MHSVYKCMDRLLIDVKYDDVDEMVRLYTIRER